MQTTGYSQKALIFLPVLLVAGVIVYGLTFPSNSCTLYFPDQYANKLLGEKRVLSPIGTSEERARRVLDELALGPINPNLQPLFPNGARITLVMQHSGSLYINIEYPDLTNPKIRFSLVKEALEKSLKASVPGSSSIKLFINGIETIR